MKSLVGGILIAIGLLIMALSGLCTGWFLLSMLVASVGSGETFGMLALPLIVGGVPFIFGYGLFAWGRWLVREADSDKQSSSEPGP